MTSVKKPRFDNLKSNDGREVGGIYRETRIPNILSNGTYSTLSWAQICKTFSTKPTEDKLKV